MTGGTRLPAGSLPAGLIVLGLGSNLGPRRDLMERALEQLDRWWGPLEVAPFYLTEPILAPESALQADFLNTVAIAHLPAPSSAREVLARLKRLEADAGRDLAPGAPHHGPRSLDIDLLIAGDARLDLPALEQSGDGALASWPGAIVVPHPCLHERRFVLQPLHDLRPSLRVPCRLGTHGAKDGDATVAELLAALPPGQRVTAAPEL